MPVSVASATPASRKAEVVLVPVRTIRQMITHRMTVPRIAACCGSESSVSASSKLQMGASIVYVAEWASDASVTGRPDSAFRIGDGPTIAVTRTRIAAAATAIELFENLTAGNLF